MLALTGSNENTKFVRSGIKWLGGFHHKLLDLKVRSFRPKVSFKIHVKGYTVKTAESSEELKKVLQLREQIFSETFAVKLKFYDFDRLDLLGDHIIVQRDDTEEVLGTYRVISSQFSKQFYSQAEFYIDEFLRQKGSKLELGRACISEELRNGRGLDLVWRGLARYAELTSAKYMFGCTSVNTIVPKEAMAVYQSCDPDFVSNEYNIYPLPKYQFPRYFTVPSRDDIDAIKPIVPALFKSYLKAGAKVYGRPALDKKFNCVDLLTIIDLQQLNPSYRKRYFQGGVLYV